MHHNRFRTFLCNACDSQLMDWFLTVDHRFNMSWMEFKQNTYVVLNIVCKSLF